MTDSKHTQFICANTLETTMDELVNHHVVPVHVKDNEPTISNQDFIDCVVDKAMMLFGNATEPTIRVSHPIKGRIPEAKNKPAEELLPHETTLYYERMAWVAYFPEIQHQIGNETLELTVGGVKAYNLDNLHSTRDTPEHFKLFVGFKNSVCTNLCISTDGVKLDLKVNSVEQLALEAFQLFQTFHSSQFQRSIDFMTSMNDQYLSEEQFAQILGKIKLYNSMPVSLKEELPRLGITDSQLGNVSTDYFKDRSHRRNSDGSIDLWKVYNLFTGSLKSSYIDRFLDRNAAIYSGIQHLSDGLNGKPCWYLN
jgi:hypothetical protein